MRKMTSTASLGIDFGTSNCVAGRIVKGAVVLARLAGDSPYLPSVLYADTTDTSEISVNEVQLQRRVKAARAAQAAAQRQAAVDRARLVILTDEQIEAREREILFREALSERRARHQRRSTAELLLGAAEVKVGDEAVKAHIVDPLKGHYFRSPKRFLGSTLPRHTLLVFERVVAALLSHTRDRAQDSLGISVERAVLGRPVTYSDTSGPNGDKQALRIMRSAAAEAGFTKVEFLLEPVAAALSYEETLSREQLVLVIDTGGGTTDCSMIRLGPQRRHRLDRMQDVIGYAGEKIGGVDVDHQIAWQCFCAAFGRDTLTRDGRRLPNKHFHNAVLWDNVPAQRDFLNSANQIRLLVEQAVRSDLVSRLETVSRRHLSPRLGRSAELTKIALTDKHTVTAPLQYIERNLSVSVKRSDLQIAAERFLERVVSIVGETVSLSGAQPDAIFVTGGMARSPVVSGALHKRLGLEAKIIVGDLFGSVAAGLAIHAERLFGTK